MPLTYRLMLLVMLLVLAVNVVVYLALLGLVGWLGARLLALDVSDSSDPLRALAVRGLVLVLIGAVLFVLLRPLWVFLRRGRMPAVVVSSRDEPDLYAFVMTIAGLVGSPLPERIMVINDVNAAAGLESFFQGRLTLYLGLPLGALTCRQLAGVVAHELGHFSQRSGMRLTWVVRRLETLWPTLIADLDRSRQTGRPSLIVDTIIYRIPRVLFVTIHGLTRPLARAMDRQLERHADLYEARVAGSQAFMGTAVRLAELKYAARETWSAVRAGQRTPQVARAVIQAHAAQTEAFRRAVVAEVSAGVTRWQDTHPSDIDRITYTAAEQAPGVYRCEAPARVLFRDFARLDQLATSLVLR